MDCYSTALATLATLLPAAAAAVAAIMSYKTAKASFSFTKKYTKNYSKLIALGIIQKKLVEFKIALKKLDKISDEEFTTLSSTFLDIKAELETLLEFGALKEEPSDFIMAKSDFECYKNLEIIDCEIERVQKAIDDLFS